MTISPHSADLELGSTFKMIQHADRCTNDADLEIVAWSTKLNFLLCWGSFFGWHSLLRQSKMYEFPTR
jgi:hypothetical protein